MTPDDARRYPKAALEWCDAVENNTMQATNLDREYEPHVRRAALEELVRRLSRSGLSLMEEYREAMRRAVYEIPENLR